ncbi:MAG: Hpt domain-containing protein [Gammaproteobacteria bacterium]|nr:Hpt domain-containing protein [Gammaproteobacteria bacterium]
MYSHIENTTLSELRLLMEDDFPVLVQAFLVDGENRLSEMNQAVAAGDLDGLRRAAHSLKGSSSNLGAITLSALCLALEQQAKRGDMYGVDEQLQGIGDEFHAVRDELSIDSPA